MPNWPHSFPPSATCRTTWRPEPEVAWALVVLSLLAALALWCCALTARQALPLSLLVPVAGAFQARRWCRRPPVAWQFDHARATVWREGRQLEEVRVHWRCGLVVLSWQAGGRRRDRQLFLPWRLPGEAVRELRQWPAHSQLTRQVAP